MFKLLGENNRMEQAYGVRPLCPTCYRGGVQEHVQRHCFGFIQRFNHEDQRFQNVWVRKDNHYGGGAMG